MKIDRQQPALRGRLRDVRKYWMLYLFIGVFTALSLVFGIYPMLSSIGYSLFKTSTILTDPVFVGFTNYAKLFKSAYFWNSFWATVLFTVISVPLNMVLSLMLAHLLNYRGIRYGRLFFKLAIFIPFIMPDVVGAVVWKQFFNTNGAMNRLLEAFGMQPVGWLTTPGTAIGVLAFAELWKHVGLYAIIFLTNYQLIDRTMYEAAYIDGSNAWQTYLHITLPALKPAFTLNVIYSIIQFLKTYTVSRIITFGGPNNATNFLSYYAYSKYEKMDFGSATAIATFLFLFVALFTLLGMKLGGDKNEAK